MARAKDTQTKYQADRASMEAGILQAAEAILTHRFNRGEALSNPELAGELLKMRLAHIEHEVFCAVFLDTRLRILAIEDLFHGSIDGCEVHPRVVAKRALELNAASVIIGHQHPSGNPEPSAADRAITARLKQGLALLDIRLVDHFVVGGASKPVSLAARGWV